MGSPVPLSTDGFFGQRAARHFGVRGQDVSTLRLEGELSLVATRLTCGERQRERTRPAPPDAAFSLLCPIDRLDGHSCWVAGEPATSRAAARWLCQPDRSARQAAMAALRPGRCAADLHPRQGAGHGRRASLPGCRQPALRRRAAGPDPGRPVRHADARRPVDRLQHAADRPARDLPPDPCRGGLWRSRLRRRTDSGRLAPWQERRAKEIMSARLASEITDCP